MRRKQRVNWTTYDTCIATERETWRETAAQLTVSAEPSEKLTRSDELICTGEFVRGRSNMTASQLCV